MRLAELLLPFYLLQRLSGSWNQDCTRSPKYRWPVPHEERCQKGVRIKMRVSYSFLYTQSHCQGRKGIISLLYAIWYLFRCSHRIGGLGRLQPRPLSSPKLCSPVWLSWPCNLKLIILFLEVLLISFEPLNFRFNNPFILYAINQNIFL